MTLRSVAFSLLIASACSRAPATPKQVPLAQLPSVDPQAILARTRVLSSDEYEGRGPGTKGEELTVRYLVDQLKMLGLKPGNTDGTYIQKVPLVGITPTPAPLVLQKGNTRLTLKWKDDFVASTKHVANSVSLGPSDLVFVGY